MKGSERERGGKKALMEKQNIFPTCMKTRSVNTSKNTHEHLLSNYRLLCVIMKDSRLARTQTPQHDDLVSTAPESFFPQMLGFMHTWIKTCLSLWWGGNLTRSFFSFHHLSTFTLLTGVTSGMWMSQIQTAHTFHSCCVKCKMAPGSWYRWQNHQTDWKSQQMKSRVVVLLLQQSMLKNLKRVQTHTQTLPLSLHPSMLC